LAQFTVKAGTAVLLACVGLWAAAAGAAEVGGLYEATVPVSGQEEAPRADAVRVALREVLVRITGDRQAAGNPGLRAVLADAGRYVQQYRYQERRPPAQPPAPGTQPGISLWVRFDEDLLNRQVRGAGMAVWGKVRPTVLFWLAVQEQQAAALISAAKRFFKVLKDYGDSPYKTKAMLEFDKCRELLAQQFDPPVIINAPSGSKFPALMEKGNTFLGQKEYARAAPVFLDAVQAGRRDRRMPEAGMRLVLCYGKLDQFLEAETIASYMDDVFPNEPDTAESLMKLGALLYEKKKAAETAAEKAVKASDKDEKEKEADSWNERAMACWDRFVALNPKHHKAADIAYMIAENLYGKATKYAKKSGQPGLSAEEKETIKKHARELYLAAVPKYERLVEQFSSTAKGVRALYKLGWIYYSAEQPDDCIEFFLRYSEAERDPKYQDDRLEAKFRAAEQMMLNGRADEAVEQFLELLTWLTKDNNKGFDITTKTAVRIQEDSSHYLGWAHDLTAESYRPQLNKFDARIKEAEGDIKTATRTIETATTKKQAAAATQEAAAKEYDEQAKNLGSVLHQADSNLPEKPDTTGVAEAEAAAALAEWRAQTAKMRAGNIKMQEQQIKGEQLYYTNQLKDVQEAKGQIQKRVNSMKKGLETLVQNAKDTEAARKKVADELGALETEIRTLNQAVIDAETLDDQWRKALELAKERFKSTDPKVKEAAAKLGRRAKEKIPETEKALDLARTALGEKVTIDTEQHLRDLKDKLPGLERVAELAARARDKMERDLMLANKGNELLEARLVAVRKALNLNEHIGKIIVMTPEEREPEAERTTELENEARDALAAVRDLQIATAKMSVQHADLEIETANDDIKRSEDRIEKIKDGRAPVRTVFEDWKRKALTYFEAFLKEFAQSDHRPDNMARLGSIHLELGNSEKAQAYLRELTERYPESDAAKQAFFDLAQAACRNEKYEEAAKTFKQILEAGANDLASVNVAYATEQMINNGQPGVALEYCKILLSRCEDDSRNDYELLRERVYQPSLVRAGEACLQLKDYPKAVEYLEKLLETNPNTAYFFDVKFMLGTAKRNLDPPDYNAARLEFNEVSMFAPDQVLANKAIMEIGHTYLAEDTKESVRMAAARFQQIVVLADPKIEGNVPLIEEAVYWSAYCFALLGMDAHRDKMVELYKTKYPNGKYRKEINSLPKAKFAAPAAAPAGAGTGTETKP